MRLSRLLPLFALVLAIAGCAGDGVRREINPPRASLQELAVQADGQWRLSVRLQNFSNVATNFVDVDAALDVGGQAAGAVRAQPGLVVGPNSAEVINLVIAPTAAAKATVASSLAAGRGVRYRLAGRIQTHDPNGKHAFEYDSTLDPVPGLDGVLR